VNIKSAALDAAQDMARQQGVQISSGDLMMVLGAFLKAGEYELVSSKGETVELDEEHNTRMKMFTGYSKLLSIRKRIETAENAVGSLEETEGDWHYQTFFNELFEGDNCFAAEVRDVLHGMDRRFPDYYDPDTTYKEDSLAWIRALDELIVEVRKEVGAEEKEQSNFSYALR
jgi:hypothetical protein